MMHVPRSQVNSGACPSGASWELTIPLSISYPRGVIGDASSNGAHSIMPLQHRKLLKAFFTSDGTELLKTLRKVERAFGRRKRKVAVGMRAVVTSCSERAQRLLRNRKHKKEGDIKPSNQTGLPLPKDFLLCYNINSEIYSFM